MYPRLSDHSYHRSRVDAQIQGAIMMTLLVVGISILLGDRFKPLDPDTKLTAPTVLVFDCRTDSWMPVRTYWLTRSVRTDLDQYVIEPGPPLEHSDSTWDPPPAPVTQQAGGSDAHDMTWRIRKTQAEPLPILVTKELYPNMYAWLLIVVVIFVSWFIYACARRQTEYMNHVYTPEDEDRPYDRPWREIRVTFWALYAVQIGALLLILV